jgi:hypothetical protein
MSDFECNRMLKYNNNSKNICGNGELSTSYYCTPFQTEFTTGVVLNIQLQYSDHSVFHMI